MKIEEIRQLADWLGAAGLSVIELQRGDEKLLLRRNARVTPSSPVALKPAGAQQPLAVTASGPGVFFATHPNEATPYVHSGEVISQGQLVGVLRIGALFFPVRTAVAGRVRQMLVSDGKSVGYGQPLIELEALG